MASQYENHEAVQTSTKKIQPQTTKKEGRDCFSALTRKIDTGLQALVVALCSNRSKCSDRNRMPCKRS